MSILDVMEQGSCPDNLLAIRMANHCAPVLCGIKISNMITLDQKDAQNLCSLCAETPFVPECLYCENNKNMMLVYNKQEMELHMQDEDNWTFLMQQGYESIELAGVIKELDVRYYNYKMGRGVFPHELGILLGYPIADIIGFIENKGNNFLYSGYWKVYHNLPKAINTFSCYDEAKTELFWKILKGWSIGHIIEQQNLIH